MIELVQEATNKKVPELRAGMTVRVHQKIKEGEKERIQIFEGLIIKMNSGEHKADKTFTVRKIVGGVGVEKIFPIYSPNIAKIEVKKQAKIRRAKLYYMRDRSGKSARLKEEHVHEQDDDSEVEKAVEELAEQKAKEEAAKAHAPEAEAEVVTPEQAEDKAEETAEAAEAEAESEPKEE